MGIGNSPSITGPYNAEGLGGHRLGQREYNLGLVDELAAGQGLEDAQVHLVAALGDEVGNHRGIDYEVLQIEFALIEKRERGGEFKSIEIKGCEIDKILPPEGDTRTACS